MFDHKGFIYTPSMTRLALGVAAHYDEIKDEKRKWDETAATVQDDIDIRGRLKNPARLKKSIAYLYNLFKGIGKNNLLLDLGCGNGLFTVPLTTIFNFVVGVDISKIMMKRCKEKRNNLDFIMASSTNLPLRDHMFDCILSLSLLQHLRTRSNVEKTLREMSRTATDRSFILLSFWDTTCSPTNLVKNTLKKEKYKLKQSLTSRLHITKYIKLQGNRL